MIDELSLNYVADVSEQIYGDKEAEDLINMVEVNLFFICVKKTPKDKKKML